MNALQGTDVATHSDYTTLSRNYKLGMAHENMQANIQGNIVFDTNSQLPREVLLETTLKAFGYNMDLWEVCYTVDYNNQYYSRKQSLSHSGQNFFSLINPTYLPLKLNLNSFVVVVIYPRFKLLTQLGMLNLSIVFESNDLFSSGRLAWMEEASSQPLMLCLERMAFSQTLCPRRCTGLRIRCQLRSKKFWTNGLLP